MSSTKIEFAVQMTCDSCVNAVQKSLENVPGIKNVDINLKSGSVVVDTTLSTLDVQKQIEKSGRKVVVRGYAGSSAGVAVLDTGENNIKGVVRFVQINPSNCLIDGTVDGLNPGQHKLSIHECGDLSQGCTRVGKLYNPNNYQGERVYGNLGTISAENDGRATFRIEDKVLNLSNIIGRSLVISDKNSGEKRFVCGIIARSAGLFENPKTICACDGVSIWNEKVKVNPKATL